MCTVQECEQDLAPDTVQPVSEDQRETGRHQQHPATQLQVSTLIEHVLSQMSTLREHILCQVSTLREHVLCQASTLRCVHSETIPITVNQQQISQALKHPNHKYFFLRPCLPYLLVVYSHVHRLFYKYYLQGTSLSIVNCKVKWLIYNTLSRVLLY